jgi:hypothetical protein
MTNAVPANNEPAAKIMPASVRRLFGFAAICSSVGAVVFSGRCVLSSEEHAFSERAVPPIAAARVIFFNPSFIKGVLSFTCCLDKVS